MRRRGTAIIETPKGILVTAAWHKTFMLPGGTTNRGESRTHATIRELREETTLRVSDIKYLFTWLESASTPHRAEHKVFLVKATGTPRPNHHDVHYIDYWNPGSNIKLSWQTKGIIEKYLREYKKSFARGSSIESEEHKNNNLNNTKKEETGWDKFKSFLGLK